jgi:hypothetical protein
VLDFTNLENLISIGIRFGRSSQCHFVVGGMFFQIRRARDRSLYTSPFVGECVTASAAAFIQTPGHRGLGLGSLLRKHSAAKKSSYRQPEYGEVSYSTGFLHRFDSSFEEMLWAEQNKRHCESHALPCRDK